LFGIGKSEENVCQQTMNFWYEVENEETSLEIKNFELYGERTLSDSRKNVVNTMNSSKSVKRSF
jgi:hypothetical protein